MRSAEMSTKMHIPRHEFYFLGIYGHSFPVQTSNMPPRMTAISTKMAPCAPKGLLGGAMGPTRCLKTAFDSNSAPQMTLKGHQNNSQIYQNGTLGISGSPLRGPRVLQKRTGSILDPTNSPNDPEILKNGLRESLAPTCVVVPTDLTDNFIYVYWNA